MMKPEQSTLTCFLKQSPENCTPKESLSVKQHFFQTTSLRVFFTFSQHCLCNNSSHFDKFLLLKAGNSFCCAHLEKGQHFSFTDTINFRKDTCAVPQSVYGKDRPADGHTKGRRVSAAQPQTPSRLSQKTIIHFKNKQDTPYLHTHKGIVRFLRHTQRDRERERERERERARERNEKGVEA